MVYSGIVITAQSAAAKTPRPLSSVKRANADSKTESLEERSQVISALANENKEIKKFRESTNKVCVYEPNPYELFSVNCGVF